MNPKRAEPFLVVLQTLRERLREGVAGVEHRLAATEIAAELSLSATPVREALARLAGEGLLEDRRGQGYFVRRLSALDVADLFRMSQAQLLIALEGRPLAGPGPAAPASADGDVAALEPVRRVERIFDHWVALGGGAALLEAHRRTQARLGPVRRLEPLLLTDLRDEADQLLQAAADHRQRVAAVRAFHRRRLRIADRLSGLLDSRSAARGAIGPI